MRLKNGFTLIEGMIVVAVFGILSAIAIPNFLIYNCREKGIEKGLSPDIAREVCSYCQGGCKDNSLDEEFEMVLSNSNKKHITAEETKIKTPECIEERRVIIILKSKIDELLSRQQCETEIDRTDYNWRR